MLAGKDHRTLIKDTMIASLGKKFISKISDSLDPLNELRGNLESSKSEYALELS